ncbi:MAG: hypothetical protein ABIR96_09475 [Bdellovibrionota bacterium]
MLRRGKILLTTLPIGAESYTLTQDEPWVREVLALSAPQEEIIGMNSEEWSAKSKIDLNFEVEKLPGGEDYSLRGNLKADVPTICAHCAGVLNVNRVGEFQLYLKLLDRSRGNEIEDSGDPDLIFVDHPEVDLRPILAEQLIVLEPFAEFPEKDSSGSPHICSKIPEIAAGQDTSFEAVSPFSKLAALKSDN